MALRPDFTLARFTPTSETRRAVDACRALVRSPSPRPLILSGPTGTGKTHLLQAVGHAVMSARTSATSIYSPVRMSREELVAAIRRDGHPGAVRERYTDFTVILLDDMQELAGEPETQRQIAALIEAALSSGARVLGATTRWPFDAESAGPAWMTARVVRLAQPTTGGMRRIVRRASATHTVDPRTVDLFARQARGDVRRALGALARWRFRRETMSVAPAG